MRISKTKTLTMTLGLLLALPLLRCSSEDGKGRSPAGADAGQEGDGGVTDGAVTADGSDGQACTPRTCAATDQCGSYDDGCGGTLDCRAACKCTADDFDTTCPPRPCEVAAGCQGGECQYAPVRCGATGAEQACAPVACAGDDCGPIATTAGDTQGLYPCGGAVCKGVTAYCDPHAGVQGGKVVYENRCVAPPRSGCGTCELGLRTCDAASDRFRCAEPSVPVSEGGGTVECDSAAAASTFIYVDAQYTAGGSDGSRQRPYTSYLAALGAAEARNARGIVIAGSPTFTEPLVVKSGISVYGGFEASPGFQPNRAQRPRWVVPATAANGNRLIGATARDIVDGTVLYHLDIETEDAAGNSGGQGISNIAFWVENATALQLEEVHVRAGRGGAGADGADGRSGDAGTPGESTSPGLAGSSCATPCMLTSSPSGALPVQAAPPAVNGARCGAGGRTDTNASIIGAAKAGNANVTSRHLGQGQVDPLVVAVGAAGTPVNASGCSSSEIAGAGQPGHAGVNGSDGQDGASGGRPQLSQSGVSTPAPTPGTAGGMGTWGSGGGAGGGYRDDCLNDPNWGGDGGGAGGPGCGGTLATGGGAGGLSVAIALVGSNQNLVLRASTVTAGSGGAGGRGGTGGAAGGGGAGASGAAGLGFGVRQGGSGGRGGRGGDGGRGGHGGGGAGGSSFGVYCETVSMTLSRDSASTISAGSAGVVGSSAGNAGATGESTAVARCTTP